MRVLLAPLEFKGTLTAREVADALEEGLRRGRAEVELELERLPLADGGPGTVDALLAALPAAKAITARVEDPLGREVEARFALCGETAFLEMASAAGLHRVSASERDALRSSTFGVGQLVRAALQAGARDVVLGLGGSATNDGGAGALQALDLELLDARGEPIGRGGAALAQLASVNASRRDPRLRSLVLASDVTSPLLGPTGASRMFAPQKGASPEQVDRLEAALAHFATVTGGNAAELPGSGAAGGTAFGFLAWLGASLRPGFELIAERVGLDAAIARADRVITGEGRFDAQSLLGKGPVRIGQRARALGKSTVLFTGELSAGVEAPFDAVVLAPGASSPSAARDALVSAAEQFARSSLH